MSWVNEQNPPPTPRLSPVQLAFPPAPPGQHSHGRAPSLTFDRDGARPSSPPHRERHSHGRTPPVTFGRDGAVGSTPPFSSGNHQSDRRPTSRTSSEVSVDRPVARLTNSLAERTRVAPAMTFGRLGEQANAFADRSAPVASSSVARPSTGFSSDATGRHTPTAPPGLPSPAQYGRSGLRLRDQHGRRNAIIPHDVPIYGENPYNPWSRQSADGSPEMGSSSRPSFSRAPGSMDFQDTQIIHGIDPAIYAAGTWEMSQQTMTRHPDMYPPETPSIDNPSQQMLSPQERPHQIISHAAVRQRWAQANYINGVHDMASSSGAGTQNSALQAADDVGNAGGRTLQTDETLSTARSGYAADASAMISGPGLVPTEDPRAHIIETVRPSVTRPQVPSIPTNGVYVDGMRINQGRSSVAPMATPAAANLYRLNSDYRRRQAESDYYRRQVTIHRSWTRTQQNPPPVEDPAIKEERRQQQLQEDCAICYGPFENAVETRCGHIFCLGCAKRWIEEEFSCPSCRQYMQMDWLSKVNVPIQFGLGRTEEEESPQVSADRTDSAQEYSAAAYDLEGEIDRALSGDDWQLDDWRHYYSPLSR